MTREEAIGLLSGLMFKGKLKEALDMAIKALEQEPVLDKIKAEIERQERWLMDTGYNACSVDIAFDAIKSVIAESEDL